MSLTEEQKHGLGVALNEANLMGFEVDPQFRIAGATFSVLTLPERGPAPEDRRVQFVFRPVGRVAASLRNGRWDDPDAEVVPFTVDHLLAIVQSFGGLSIYGWEYLDLHEADLTQWGDRLSLDWTSGNDGLSHSITVFQDAGDRILNFCVWFDALEVRDHLGNLIPLDSFITAGKRWWDAFYAGDERTQGCGMYPIKKAPDAEPSGCQKQARAPLVIEDTTPIVGPGDVTTAAVTSMFGGHDQDDAIKVVPRDSCCCLVDGFRLLVD